MIEHSSWCGMKSFGGHTDAAKRLSDAFNLHRVAAPYDSIGKWIAVRLSDGSSDQVLYDTKRDAIRHQRLFEQFYCFVKLVPTTMSQCEAEVMLTVHRRAYDNGMRLADPEDKNGGRELIKRSAIEDQLALANGMATNLYLPGRDFQ